MKRIKIQFTILIFIALNINAQSIYETYTTPPLSTTVRRTIEKQGISYRLGQGAASIVPVFEGDKWEEDAKNAVIVACQLVEECIPTTYPIKILFRRGSNFTSSFVSTTVRFMNNTPSDSYYEKFDGKYARIPLWVSEHEYYTKVPSATLKRYAVLKMEKPLFHQESTLFSQYDGTVVISSSDIFSTSTNGIVESGKYDLATVVIREIVKILGISSTVRQSGANSLSILDSNNMISIYDYRIFGSDMPGASAFSYATSGNAKLANNYSLYSPSTFTVNKSLNYLAIDNNNTETLLFQPNLPKETSILKVSSLLREILSECGWKKIDHCVGISPNSNSGQQIKGEVINPFSGASRASLSLSTMFSKIREDNDVLYPSIERRLELQESYTPDIRKEAPLVNTINKNSLVNSSYSYQYFSKDGVLENYEEDGLTLEGWQLYLIKKDGTLDLISTAHPALWDFPFDISGVLSNIPNIDQYQRTSDGYLRARVNRNCLPKSPVYVPREGFVYNEVQHIYIYWYPEKPKLSRKINYLRASNPNPNSYLKNIDLTFSNVAGATSGRLIQKEYDGARVFTCSYDIDLSSASCIVNIDRELLTTFQLVATNAAGSTVSDIITIQPEIIYTMNCSILNNNLSVSFVNRNNRSIDNVDISTVRITNASNSSTSLSTTNLQNNLINVSSLPSGIYILTITDSNGKNHSAKFIK